MRDTLKQRLEHVRERMEKVPLILRPVIALTVISVLVILWNLIQSIPFVRALALGSEVRASGTLEAEPISVTAELGGRVVEIFAQEGDFVAADALLIRLDSASAEADWARARGALAEAQAKRDLAKSGARAEERAQADAALAQAIAARDGARRAYENTLAILRNPQELDSRISRARTQAAVAEQQIEAARAQEAQAIAMLFRYRGRGSDLEKTLYASFDLQVRAAQENIAGALAQRDGALGLVRELSALRENPLELMSQLHQAEARWREAEAAAQIAQATRDLVYNGATKEEVAIAEAGVAQAQGALNAAQARLDKLSLRAPAAGWVSKRSTQIGEVIAPGTVVLSLINTDKLTMTVFVPQDRIGRIRPGHGTRVAIDSFPGRTFGGRVIFISPNAEFTPRNVQTAEGRAVQVFGVKIRLDPTESLLRPGMPGQAAIP